MRALMGSRFVFFFLPYATVYRMETKTVNKNVLNDKKWNDSQNFVVFFFIFFLDSWKSVTSIFGIHNQHGSAYGLFLFLQIGHFFNPAGVSLSIPIMFGRFYDHEFVTIICKTATLVFTVPTVNLDTEQDKFINFTIG